MMTVSKLVHYYLEPIMPNIHESDQIAFEADAILEFVLNEHNPGIMARYGAGLNGPGIVVFPNTHSSVAHPVKDTGWHLVHIAVLYGKEPGKFYGFADPIEDPDKIANIIANLRRQLAKC